ncbi:Glucoside xylosyltransferase 2, partial [Armadillidium vulgare]
NVAVTVNHHEIESKKKEISPVFVITICGDKYERKNAIKDDVNRQIEQAYVLIKSAALLTKNKLRFFILVNDDSFYNTLLAKLNQWPEKIRLKFSLEKEKIWYPDTGNFMEMFRLCATERLFLLKVLPSVDSVVYLDTDMIFLKPPEDLWEEFSKFDSFQISGMAPCLFHYTPELKIPYYGKTGLIDELWMMNLTRMKTFPGGWIETCLEVYNEYRTSIRIADQDIANIIFSKNPKFLYDLECQWNYRDFTCYSGKNLCKESGTNGIFLLHGNAFNFYSDKNQKFKILFREFLHFDVNKPLEELIQTLKRSLKNINYKINKSKCAYLLNIDKLLTKSLENTINGFPENKISF